MSDKERDNAAGHVRDRRNGKWWWCHNAVIDQYGPTLGPHGLAVYAALCRYANDEGSCWPSVSKIASDTGMSTNRARRSLIDLQRVSLISIEHRKRKDDLNLPSVYTLLEVVEYSTTESTPRSEVLHVMRGGTPPDEVGVLHHVEGGTPPRGDKEDSIKKTNLEKDSIKRVAADAAAPSKPVKPVSPSKAKPQTKTTRVENGGKTPRTPQEHTLCEELVDGLSEVTGMLRQTNRAALYDGGWQLVGLLAADITPSKAHIVKAFGLKDPGPGVWWWYRDDQRVKMDLAKGLAAPMPKPRQVVEMYAVSLRPLPGISAPVNGNGHARAAPPQTDGIGALRARLRGEIPPGPDVIDGRVIDGNSRRSA